MTGAISGISPYMSSYRYLGAARGYGGTAGMRGQAAQAARAVQAAQKTGTAAAPGRVHDPDSPVEPVRPVTAVDTNGTNGISYAIPFLRKGMDPAELAVRMRIQYGDAGQTERGRNALPDDESDAAREGAAGIESVREAVQETECQTCKERKYQDGSDDSGVSYQTPTHIAPEQAAQAVMGHEMEHVVREQAKAEREERKVISQSVTMHTAVCPECGRVYVSGGTTRTTTAAGTEAELPSGDQGKGDSSRPRTPFEAVA